MDNAHWYAPEAFRVADRVPLESFVDQVGFGALLSREGDGGIRHTWLPVMLSEDRTILEGHLARANPHWRGWEQDDNASVIFLGPHAYVSPTAYAEPNSVPTWNYASARIDGRIRIVEEAEQCWSLVSRLVERHEGTSEGAWRLRSDSDFVQGLLRGIVCFRIEIQSFVGSFKMSQNKTADERQRVVDYLAGSSAVSARLCASFMTEWCQKNDRSD